MDNLNQHYEQVSKFFKSENLVSLSDNKHEYDGLNTMEILNLEKVNPKFTKFNKFKNIKDLKNCNNDLKYLTANLYLYRPYINKPLEEFTFFQDKKLFTYLQNGPDWIYSIYVSCCFEKLYNYWDRIGDTLAYYFDLNIAEHRVTFPIVIDKMKTRDGLLSDKNFKFLLDFRENEFKEFNDQRKEVVHYYQFETTYHHEFLDNSSDENEIKRLWKWKKNMPEYFKNHLKLSCDGFVKTYELIKNLP